MFCCNTLCCSLFTSVKVYITFTQEYYDIIHPIDSVYPILSQVSATWTAPTTLLRCPTGRTCPGRRSATARSGRCSSPSPRGSRARRSSRRRRTTPSSCPTPSSASVWRQTSSTSSTSTSPTPRPRARARRGHRGVRLVHLWTKYQTETL